MKQMKKTFRVFRPFRLFRDLLSVFVAKDERRGRCAPPNPSRKPWSSLNVLLTFDSDFLIILLGLSCSILISTPLIWALS